MQFRTWLESQDTLQNIVNDVKNQYPGIEVIAWEGGNKIELAKLVVPPNQRNQGIGQAVVKRIQDYAASVNKPVVLRPEPEKGKKAALDRFYRNLGFKHNQGRNMDYTLSSPMARTMYWKRKDG